MAEKRYALLIASYAYEDQGLAQLIAPPQDVAALAEVLDDPAIGHFDEIKTLVNEPQTTVRRALARFFQRKKRDDLLLLYFSGHGLLDEQGRLYLAVKDTEHDIPRATAIPAAAITDEMDNNRSRRQVLILDCCHSGAFDRTKKDGVAVGTRVGTANAFVGSGYGRVVLTASDVTQYAWEGDQAKGEPEQSVFTRYLVQGLRSGEADADQDGRITLDEWYDYAHSQVVSQGAKQTPGKWSYKQQGDIVVANNPNPIVNLAELPSELQQAIEGSLPWMRRGAVDGLAHLLQSSDKALAQTARKALERLVDDDSHSVSTAATEALGGVSKSAPASSQPAPRSPVVIASPPEPEPILSLPDTLTITTPISMELIHIPAGEFLMGSASKVDKDAQDNEQPQHTVTLADYYIAKTPVTNAQYVAFVEAIKRQKPKHWKGGQIPTGKDNHPVVNVSWQDAVAFCQWLSEESGQTVRLPSEAEWEKAARGPEGLIYPWGNEWDAKRCNTKEGGPGDTTAVGTYPEGASPYGMLDMAGNVWEWCATKWQKPYPYDVSEDEWTDQYLAGTGDRVLRGGSWYSSRDLARCACRGGFYTSDRSGNGGCRVVVSPSS